MGEELVQPDPGWFTAVVGKSVSKPGSLIPRLYGGVATRVAGLLTPRVWHGRPGALVPAGVSSQMR